jgi:hypothetical protein
MSTEATNLAQTVKAMWPMVPARNLEASKCFYVDLGFAPEVLSGNLVEMHVGPFSFIPPGCYVQEWPITS